MNIEIKGISQEGGSNVAADAQEHRKICLSSDLQDIYCMNCRAKLGADNCNIRAWWAMNIGYDLYVAYMAHCDICAKNLQYSHTLGVREIITILTRNSGETSYSQAIGVFCSRGDLDTFFARVCCLILCEQWDDRKRASQCGARGPSDDRCVPIAIDGGRRSFRAESVAPDIAQDIERDYVCELVVFYIDRCLRERTCATRRVCDLIVIARDRALCRECLATLDANSARNQVYFATWPSLNSSFSAKFAPDILSRIRGMTSMPRLPIYYDGLRGGIVINVV